MIDNKNIELDDVWESNLQEKEKTNLASNFIYSLNNFNWQSLCKHSSDYTKLYTKLNTEDLTALN